MMTMHTTSEFQRRQHRAKAARATKSTLANLLMIAFAVYFLFPILWLGISTTKSTAELYSTGILETGKSLAHNIEWLNSYNNGIFWRWCLNSLFISLVTAILSVTVSSMAGYALTKYKFRLSRAFSAISLAAMMVPQAATVIPLFLMVKKLNLINSHLGVILPMIASPFGIYFMTVYLKEAMPGELIDSGRVDGASEYRIFAQIAIPIMKPGLVTLFLISFTSTWNNFFLPLVLLNNANLYPVTVGLKIWVANLNAIGVGEPLYPLIMIASFISIFPMLVMFTFLRKYITSGITMGSIKT